MIIVMGEFRLNPESIEVLRNEIAEVIKKVIKRMAASHINSQKL